ncbi:hypothetical protein CLHUN_24130 [Ruminiclostridium hungatei]|uniref:HPr kinase/phosphorylase n=1 Tax=Ruminiclostridium hungatei TaxID=48256 RepID=A0A1V4SIU4_RUMHU|nr:hypothetical protein [Ruminiclostridium hungatei]OPX43693.1 hypothetical protein CLHUN_24130 [Ruminiclostridium hungatei]
MKQFYTERYLSHKSIGWFICIKNYVEELDTTIAFMFKMFEEKEINGGITGFRGSFYLQYEDEKGIRLSFEDNKIAYSCNPGIILGALYEAAFLPVFLEKPQWWYMHGGAVSLNRKAVIMTGTTHAGKTTMISTMCSKGCLYLSDDIVPVSVDNYYVTSFPHPITSRNIYNMDAETLRAYFDISRLKMLGKNKLAPNGDEKFIMNPKSYVDTGEEIPMAAIVILKRKTGGFTGVGMKRLDSMEAFISLLLNSRNPECMEKNRSTAAGILKKCPVYEIEYAESSEAAPYLLELLSN